MGSVLSFSADETPSIDLIDIQDVVFVRQAFLHLLPRELVDKILDFAEYNPHLISKRDAEVHVSASDSPSNDSQEVYLLSPHIPEVPDHLPKELLNPLHIRSVTFTLVSNDQGWGGDVEHQGSYRASWTWFEAAIVRPGNPIGPSRHPELDINGQSRWQVQRNVHVSRDPAHHVITWTDHDSFTGEEDESSVLDETGHGLGKGFVNALRPGDQVAIIARARYPGWTNVVRSAAIEIDISI